MSRVRLFISMSLPLVVASCASTATGPRDESMVEVLERSASTPQLASADDCTGDEVPYCAVTLDSGRGLDCACVNRSELLRHLERYRQR